MAEKLNAAQGSNISNEVIAAFAIEADQAQRDIDEASGRKRAILKRAKGAGVKTKMLLQALSLKRQDPDEVTADVRDTIRYISIIAPMVKLKQTDLFTGQESKPLNAKAKGNVQAWEAEQKGYDVGLNGGTLDDSIYPAGTEARTHFSRGFLRGQTVIAERMGENAKKADPSLTKRRGGKAAAAGAEVEARTDELANGVTHGQA